jgi:hypothetical protein
MSSGLSRPALTPCSLVLIAFPAAFLFMPEGIPFIYAACGGGISSHVTNMQTNRLSPCKSANGTEAVIVHSATLDNSSAGCEFKVTADLEIISHADQCDALVETSCAIDMCSQYVIPGPTRETVIEITQCNTNTDTHWITIAGYSCDCSSFFNNKLVLETAASSSPCN